jgi:hypothetical protein
VAKRSRNLSAAASLYGRKLNSQNKENEMRALPIAAVAVASALVVTPFAFAGDYQGPTHTGHSKGTHHHDHSRLCDDLAKDNSLLSVNLGAVGDLLTDNDKDDNSLRIDALRNQERRLCSDNSGD